MHYFKLIAITAVLTISTISCKSINSLDSNITDKTSATETNNKSDNLSYLKQYNAKYPREAELFTNQNFTNRLENLIGKSNYDFLTKTWAVESAIEINNDIFVASACQAHNCFATNFIITVDFKRNIMSAGIRNNGKVTTYSENGNIPAAVTKWKNRVN